MIPYGKQSISDEDIKAVTEALKSDWITQGPAIDEFESKVATYCDVKHGVAVNSATAALHIACMALGLKEDDLIWTSPNSFVASVNCGRYCGAEVDFVDIDPNTYNMSPDILAEKLEQAKAEGKLPNIVIPVHMGGQSCEMGKIKALADRYGFKIIEDASHCIGADYKGKKIGNCEFSDIAVFSFHPVKIITTGEGGMAMTNNDELAEKMRVLRHHGIERGTNADEPWFYEQVELSYNYRITDFQCALGSSQMNRLDSFIERRREIAQKYTEGLVGLDLQTPFQHCETESSWHLYIIQLDDEKRRAEIFKKLREKGIGCAVHYIPIHIQPYYKSLGFKDGDFPISEDYYSRAISLPVHPAMTDEEQGYVIETLKELL